MGTSKQLGNGVEDDAFVPTKMAGKQLTDRYCVVTYLLGCGK